MNKLVKLGKLVQLVKSAVRGFTPWALGIIIIGLTITGLMGKFAQKTEAAWYDDLFAYRRAIRFGNTGATVTNQKVLIAVNTSSTSGLIQDERMQTDCDDTRFTNANGLPLQYFIDVNGGAGVGCNDASTDYYVLMPRIEGGGDTLMYMYYGNYNAVSASTGANFSQSTFSPTSGPSIAAEEIGTAPLLYWNFDEGYGTTANDLMIQRNNGTITGSWATEDRCVSGKCLQLNGSSHKVIKTYASDFELDVSSNSFTVSLWMRHASALAGTDTLVSRVSSGGYKIAASSGSFCFAIDDDASTFDPDDSACTTSTYNDSLWHYVTAVKNGTTSITLYVDGNQVAQDASLLGTGSLSGSSPEFDVGVDGSSNFFDGTIDEVKFYNTAKTAAQIKAEYSSRSATGEGSSSVAGGNTIPWMSNGLVGYWRMDEKGQNDCDGTNDSCDVSGNANHGAWTNGAIDTDSGKFGSSIWFDGTTDYVSVADSTSLSVTTQVSLGLWINSSSSVASESLAVKNNSYRLVTDANSFPVCQVSDGTTWQTAATSGTALTTSTWYHVGCSYDGKTIQVFVNGVETGRNALASSIGDNANALEFGRDAGGTYTDFGGVLDEARLYNRGLSPREIEQISNFGPGPVGWWKMDENTGTSANDTSGNDNTLTLSTASWNPGKFGAGWNGDGTLWLSRADDADFDFTAAENFTINLWFKSDSATNPGANEYLIDKEAGTGYGIYLTTGGLVTFGIDSDGTWTPADTAASTADVYDGTWHHLAAVKTGATKIEMYVDGLLVGSDTTIAATGDLSNADSLTVGDQDASNDGDEFFGDIDNVQTYRYARTPKQIVEDMLGSPKAVSAGGGNAGQTIYWKFDEQNGSTANNAVLPPGQGEWDGTITGADWRMPENNCKVNGCLTFPTTTDEVSAGDTSFTDSLAAMTVSLWVSPTTLATSKGIVSKSNFGAGSSFAITTGSTNTEIRVFIASSTSSDENYFTTTDFTLTTSTFSHLAMVYDGALPASERVKVYKDGRRTSGSVTGTIPTSMVASSTANLTAGESGSTSYQALDSHLDEVKLYNFALTASEVLVDMNAGSAAAFGGVLGVPGATPHDNEGFGGNPPVGWWKLDENTGTSAVDSSGNGLSGTLNNGPVWTLGRLGSSLDFDGSDDSVTITDSSTTDFNGDFTLSVWIKHSGTSESGSGAGWRIISKQESSDQNLYHIRVADSSSNVSNGLVEFEIRSSGGTVYESSSQTNIKDGGWHFIIGQREGSTMKLYIDGKLEDTTSATSNSILPAADLFIGYGTASWPERFDGQIDDVRIYNYARTPAQIAYDYNRGAPVAHYKFDECQGNTAFDSSLKPGPSTVDMSGGKPGNITIGSLGSQTSLGTCADGSSASAWNNGTTGKMNASLDFDGTDDVVTVANDIVIDMDVGLSNGFTISAWINAATAGESNVGQIWNKGTNSYCRTDNPSGVDVDIECNVDLATTDANVNVSASATTGSWYHVAMTYDDASKITVYVNGKNRGTNTGSGATAADTSSLLIGGPSTANFDGRIDDFRIHAYEMTAGQMLRLYNEGSAVRFGPQTGSP